METTKPFWQSKTIWSDVATLVMSVLPLVHPISPKIFSVVLAVLGAFGIYGRVDATTKIG